MRADAGAATPTAAVCVCHVSLDHDRAAAPEPFSVCGDTEPGSWVRKLTCHSLVLCHVAFFSSFHFMSNAQQLFFLH